MKTIKNLLQPITDFSGNSISDGRTIFTPKLLMLLYLSGHLGTSKEDVFALMSLGQKINDCQDDTINIEDSEFALLEKTMAPPKHPAILMAGLYKAMDQPEKSDDD